MIEFILGALDVIFKVINISLADIYHIEKTFDNYLYSKLKL